MTDGDYAKVFLAGDDCLADPDVKFCEISTSHRTQISVITLQAILN